MGIFAQLTKIGSEEAAEKKNRKNGRSVANHLGTTGGAAVGDIAGKTLGFTMMLPAFRGMGPGPRGRGPLHTPAEKAKILGGLALMLGGGGLGAGIGNYLTQDSDDKSIAEALSAAGGGVLGGLGGVQVGSGLGVGNALGAGASLGGGAALGASGGASLAHALRSHGDEKLGEWSDDEKMDALIASGLASSVVPFGNEALSAATAPGGHYVQGPLREVGRSILEGTGGAIAGGIGGAALEHLLRRSGVGHARPPRGTTPTTAGAAPGMTGGLLGALLGGGVGAAHGRYASRRNQREETGDYHWQGHNKGRHEGPKKD
jgi:hypothetical protein